MGQEVAAVEAAEPGLRLGLHLPVHVRERGQRVGRARGPDVQPEPDERQRERRAGGGGLEAAD
jgi:hypothetical protein